MVVETILAQAVPLPNEGVPSIDGLKWCRIGEWSECATAASTVVAVVAHPGLLTALVGNCTVIWCILASSSFSCGS